MKRVLRITASAFFGLVTVALVVLWVRSYWRADVVYYPAGRQIIANSMSGKLQINLMANDVRTGWGPGWGWNSFAIDQLSPESTKRPSRAWGSDAHTTSVSCPVWSVLLPFAIAAVVTGWNPRFSLRSLLVATTLVAIVLGLICYSIELRHGTSVGTSVGATHRTSVGATNPIEQVPGRLNLLPSSRLRQIKH